MAVGFFTGDNTPDSYEARERKRRLAEAMLLESTSTAPIGSWTQGAARLAQALSGKVQESRINAKDKEATAEYSRLASTLFGGGSPSSARPSAPSAPGPVASGGGTTVPAAGGKSFTIPPAYMPILEKASQETGIPVPILAAKIQQEGQFRPDAQGAAGEIGMSQVLPSTARQPGYGVQPVDPEVLRRDPEQQIMFGARYLAGRAKAAGINDWNDPAQAAKALTAYNGGGDPRYAQNVFRWLPAGGQQPPQPTQVAQAGMTPDGMPTSPVASDAPPMAYAPGQQAIAQAAPQSAPRGQQLAQAVGAPAMPQPQPTGNIQAAMMQILSDPRFSPQQKAQAMQMYQMGQRDEGVTYVDAGDKLVPVNKRGQVVGQPITKSRDSADWEPIKDGDGNVVGSFNKRTSEFKPMGGQPGMPQARNEIELADGTKVPIPEGGGRKEFVADIQKQNASVIANAPKAFSTLENAYKQVVDLEKHPGLKTDRFGLTGATGLLGGVTSQIRGTQTYQAQARIEQLLGGTFLQAFEALKGGGAITQIEGEKAQMAMSRLGKPGVGPEEYAAALKDFKDAVRSGMEKLKRVKGMDRKDFVVPEAGETPSLREQPKNPTRAIPKGATATNPQTKEKIIFDGEKWVPAQ